MDVNQNQKVEGKEALPTGEFPRSPVDEKGATTGAILSRAIQTYYKILKTEEKLEKLNEELENWICYLSDEQLERYLRVTSRLR